jgi:hypothetical protein
MVRECQALYAICYYSAPNLGVAIGPVAINDVVAIVLAQPV